MKDKQIIGGRGSDKIYTTLNTIEVMLENEKLKDTLKAKEQECTALRDEKAYTDMACECFEKQLQAKERECDMWKNLAVDNGAVALKYQQQLDQLKAENEELKRRITKIFACLINANRADKIVDTLWVGGVMTLWDYIAQTLEIKGDQIQIEEQILQKISEVEESIND